MTNMRDGLGFEEVNQEVTDTQIISGANIYASTQLTSPIISGGDIINTEGELTSINVASGTNSSVYGGRIQAGSGTLTGGSNLWVVFPSAFTLNPTVVGTETLNADIALLISAGSVNTGSFYIEGPTAAGTFSWIAVGL